MLYYVGDVSTKEITTILKKKLPRYMIPNNIETLEVMPLTANGKIDRVYLKNYMNIKKEK
jgi:D-alanine--poly(phosphoribitol) ligase subunit 1